MAGLASRAPGDEVSRASPRKRLVFRLPFVNRLLPGTYFTDCAVEGEVAGKRLVLQRISDALVVRTKEVDNLTASEIVDLRAPEPPTTETG